MLIVALLILFLPRVLANLGRGSYRVTCRVCYFESHVEEYRYQYVGDGLAFLCSEEGLNRLCYRKSGNVVTILSSTASIEIVSCYKLEDGRRE